MIVKIHCCFFIFGCGKESDQYSFYKIPKCLFMEENGLSSDIIEAAEQRVTNSFLFNLAMGVDDAHNQMKQIEKT